MRAVAAGRMLTRCRPTAMSAQSAMIYRKKPVTLAIQDKELDSHKFLVGKGSLPLVAFL